MDVSYKESVWSLDHAMAIKDIAQLNLDEVCDYPESDYGHGYVYRSEKGYECYSIPMYGGKPYLEAIKSTPEEAFKEVCSWT